MKRGSISARRLYATLVGLSLTLLLSCSKATAASHLGNTTYLIRLMNFGGVPAGLLVFFGADSITTDYILGEKACELQAGPCSLVPPPLPPPKHLLAPTEARHVTGWAGPVSGLLPRNCRMQMTPSKCSVRVNTNLYQKKTKKTTKL